MLRAAVAGVIDRWTDVHGIVHYRVILGTDWFDWDGDGQPLPKAGQTLFCFSWQLEGVRQ